jgi:hypothetical protein
LIDDLNMIIPHNTKQSVNIEIYRLFIYLMVFAD